MTGTIRGRSWRAGAALLSLWLLAGCGAPEGEPVTVVIPRGASFHSVVDTLAARGIIREQAKPVFRLYGRLRRVDRAVRAGHYEFRRDERWGNILSDLSAGRGVTIRLTVPEGFTLTQMAVRLAVVAELPPDSVRTVLQNQSQELAERFGVPGPGLEGYLFPDTYHFQPGIALEEVLEAMVRRYRAFWNEERRERMAALGMDEREVVTLASIVQAEAVWTREMPLISSVYHNRLRTGQGLYADPTVLYALGGHRDRLLYAAIDSVADNPYNTYRHAGLPPGPIGSPGEAALEATLSPEDSNYFYFVARPDGTHVFTRTLDEHNVEKARARREWDTTTRGGLGVRSPDLDSTPVLPQPDPSASPR